MGLGYAFPPPSLRRMIEESIAEGERARTLDPAVKITNRLQQLLYAAVRAVIESLRRRGRRLIFIPGLWQILHENWEGRRPTVTALRDRSVPYTQSEGDEPRRAGQAERGMGCFATPSGNRRARVTERREYRSQKAYAVLGDKQAALRVLPGASRRVFCHPNLMNGALTENIAPSPSSRSSSGRPKAHEGSGGDFLSRWRRSPDSGQSSGSIPDRVGAPEGRW